MLVLGCSFIVTTLPCFRAVTYVQLETNGDPWQNYPDVDPDNVNYFWDYVYFVIIVLTTIGFGDISPITTLGRLFLVFYILVCLVSSQSSNLLMQYDIRTLLHERRKLKKENTKNVANNGINTWRHEKQSEFK